MPRDHPGQRDPHPIPAYGGNRTRPMGGNKNEPVRRLLNGLPHPMRRAKRFGRTWLRFCQHRTATIFPRPVIIGGSPNAGTTAIAALLAKAAGAESSNDPFWRVAHYDAQGFLLPDILEGRLTAGQFVD